MRKTKRAGWPPKIGIAAWTVVCLALTSVSAVEARKRKAKKKKTDGDPVVATLRERGIDPAAVVYPYAITEDMKVWAKSMIIGTATSDLDKLLRLQEALLDPARMSVKYRWGYTGTAIEVFDQQQANCLAFTNLFVAMARAIKVRVYYLGVNDIESFRREGDLVVVSDHIAVGYGPLSDRKIFDFSETPPDNYHNFHKLDDLTVISMFHSNRGAESLQAGLVEDSIDWLRTAVRVDPDLTNAWVNLGVALRRAGDLPGAEDAYRRAIDLDPRTYSAYQNLASLLRLQRRYDEATAYESVLAAAPSRNPYTYISLGDISLTAGRLEEAERLYRRATRLNARDADAFAALGQLAYNSGDLKKAKKLLNKARKVEDAGEHPRVRHLERTLARKP